jgi:hypothetical protein
LDYSEARRRHGFFDRQGVFAQLDFPAPPQQTGNGINALGVIVGDFFDSAASSTGTLHCTKKLQGGYL